MNPADLLHPNLMADSVLREHLATRQLNIPNIDQLTHEQLVEIFSKFAVPLHQRQSSKSINIPPNANPISAAAASSDDRHNKRIRRERITGPTANESNNFTHTQDVPMEDVIQSSKKFKIGSAAEESRSGLKRLFNKLEIEPPPSNCKRVKITWP